MLTAAQAYMELSRNPAIKITFHSKDAADKFTSNLRTYVSRNNKLMRAVDMAYSLEALPLADGNTIRYALVSFRERDTGIVSFTIEEGDGAG